MTSQPWRPKQADAVFTPDTFIFPPIFYPLLRGLIFSYSGPSDLIPSLLFYIKFLYPINKQFSIDSFLDLEGLHWDFSSTIASSPASVPFSAFVLTAKQ